MINSMIDYYVNLDENSKNKLNNIVFKFINPIKLYLIVIMFLLLIMCISNYYISKKICNLNFQNS